MSESKNFLSLASRIKMSTNIRLDLVHEIWVWMDVKQTRRGGREVRRTKKVFSSLIRKVKIRAIFFVSLGVVV